MINANDDHFLWDDNFGRFTYETDWQKNRELNAQKVISRIQISYSAKVKDPSLDASSLTWYAGDFCFVPTVNSYVKNDVRFGSRRMRRLSELRAHKSCRPILSTAHLTTETIAVLYST